MWEGRNVSLAVYKWERVKFNINQICCNIIKWINSMKMINTLVSQN